MTRMRACVGAAALLAAGVASAAPAPEAMDVDRQDAPPARGELGFDGGAPLGDWAVAASLGYLDQPIALRGPTGLVTHPVSSRETLGLGGGLALGDSALVDLGVGFAHQSGDRLQGLGDDGALAAWVPLDARLGARARVMNGAHLSVFVRGEVTAPFGNERQFAGDAGWTGAWNLILRAQLPGGVIAAASAGVRLRGQEVVIGDRRLGDESLGALGVVVPLPPVCHLWCAGQVSATGELVGILGDSDASLPGPSPVEARIGIVSRPRAWLEIATRVGIGLDDDVGAPRWRATVSAAYRQPSAPVAAKRDEPRTPVEDPVEDD
jgi:hypothetical protein